MFTDSIDILVEEVRKIRKRLEGGIGQEAVRGVVQRPVDAGRYIVEESNDLPQEEKNLNGTVTVPAGEMRTLAEYDVARGSGIHVHAVGATDAQGLEYALFVDERVIAGTWTQSPLGTVTNPFSFNEYLGGYIAADQAVELKARNTNDGGSVDLAGRIHLEQVEERT